MRDFMEISIPHKKHEGIVDRLASNFEKSGFAVL